MNHTTACMKMATVAQTQINAYETEWPNHCKACGGWGEINDDGDHCECVENGCCPRCGEKAIGTSVADDPAPCKACGWNWSNGRMDDPECQCGAVQREFQEMIRRQMADAASQPAAATPDRGSA